MLEVSGGIPLSYLLLFLAFLLGTLEFYAKIFHRSPRQGKYVKVVQCCQIGAGIDGMNQATPTMWATRLMRTTFSSTQSGGPAACNIGP